MKQFYILKEQKKEIDYIRNKVVELLIEYGIKKEDLDDDIMLDYFSEDLTIDLFGGENE